MSPIEPDLDRLFVPYEKIAVHLEDISYQSERPGCPERRNKLVGRSDEQVMDAFSEMNQHLLSRHFLLASPG